MNDCTAAAYARRLREATCDAVEAAGIRAALAAGGRDPDAVAPCAEPEGYLARADYARMVNHPGYLGYQELVAMQDAREAAMGGRPF
jgi:hypothetical protein